MRFNDQVRVKKIKATGKNRSLHDDSDEDEGDEEGEGFTDADEGFNENEEGAEEDENEKDDGEDEEEQWDISGSDDEESEEGLGDEHKNSNEGAAIQRSKQDLFADDEDETDRSEYYFLAIFLILNGYDQIRRRTNEEWRRSRTRLQS